ncbi:hypothetical protein P7K49_016671, partial [Saguinus oedipus]
LTTGAPLPPGPRRALSPRFPCCTAPQVPHPWASADPPSPATGPSPAPPPPGRLSASASHREGETWERRELDPAYEGPPGEGMNPLPKSHQSRRPASRSRRWKPGASDPLLPYLELHPFHRRPSRLLQPRPRALLGGSRGGLRLGSLSRR